MRTSLIAMILAAAPGLGIESQPPAPTIAVLEQPQCVEPPTLSARPLFMRASGAWVPLDTPAASQGAPLGDGRWTVAHEGRDLGPVHTVDPQSSGAASPMYPRDRRLTVETTPRPPSIPNAAGAFRGWCGAPQLRPLVLVAPDHHEDPDRWTAITPPPETRDQLFAAFREAAGAAVRCPKDPEVGVPFDYTSADLKVVEAYRDQAGRTLVALRLDERLNGCDGPVGGAWDAQWFLLAGGARALGSALAFVDAGDYDGDGESEVLFWYRGYNEDGYTLLYEGLTRSAVFRWTYH